ncbi:MAG: geranylgeranyl reductase family protein [Candidatus Methanodesulfokora sp.]|jgi:digeranylgeranylglycerophospholipid reductase
MEKWDVIVVGSGPAGAAAARASAEKGAKTLLIEAKPEIKAWKPCGEGVSKETFRTAGIEPEPGIVSNELNMRVYAPNGKYVEIGQTGYAINKDLFLLELARKAVEAGSDLIVGEPVESVYFRNGIVSGVKTARSIYEARVVIGADGYNSIVAKSCGMDNRTELIPTYQYKMTGVKIEHHSGHIFLGNSIAPGGYAWIFPKSDKIFNVGIGVRPGSPKLYLDKFIRNHPEYFSSAKTLGAGGAPVPIGGLAKEIMKDGVILIGDAAGTVIPFTGAGIHSSIAAGKAAGEIAAEAALSGHTSKENFKGFFLKYEPWIKRINDSLRAMRVFERVTDDEFNQLAEILTDEDVLNLANGINMRKTVQKLLGHPILAVKIAHKLLTSG